MATTNSWYVQMKYFIEHDFRVILHDFKGQLKSDKPRGPYTFAEHAEETIMILDELSIGEAHFMGTSYGGEVALNIGFRYPDYVKSLVIIDSVSETNAKMVEDIERWIKLCENNDGETFFWGMANDIYGKTFLEENMVFLEARAQATSGLPKSYFDGQIELYKTFIRDVYMTDRLSEIKAPTLVICGEDDKLKPKEFSEIIAKQIKGSQYAIIPDCGHVTIFEKPKELEELIVKFITSLKM
ncbi:MAG: alpha/beta fold hydrolase [Acholeplasmataceae bacterium]|nr:alpha/beta fold hydrolase [Acholeplasmataceae bacterium]